jgi:hypothetical protein
VAVFPPAAAEQVPIAEDRSVYQPGSAAGRAEIASHVALLKDDRWKLLRCDVIVIRRRT